MQYQIRMGGALLRRVLAVFGLALFAGSVSCSAAPPPDAVKADGLYAVFETSMGPVVCKLFNDKIPITVGNFVGLAEGTKEWTDPKTSQKVKKPFYDGLKFHRVIKNFMLQGGDPLGNGTGGPGYSFIDEFDPSLRFDAPGMLAMANAGPGTNGSQFFITQVPTPNLNDKHTIFGRVVAGQDVVDKIATAPVNGSTPTPDIVIKKLTIVRTGAAAKAFDAAKAFAMKDQAAAKPKTGEETQMKEFLQKQGADLTKAVATASGLRYIVIKPGTGAQPKQGETIPAHYTGYLTNGTKFESSRDRGQPFQTAIGVRSVIKGWDEGFLGMKVGEKRWLVIPPDLAYGGPGRPPLIPPNATLLFDVELLDVVK